MSRFIVLLPKTPWSQGRVGPEHLQDWYRSTRVAQDLARDLSAPVVVPSAHVDPWYARDIDHYQLHFMHHAPMRLVRYLEEGVETIGQIEAFERLVSERNKTTVHVVSTWLHYPRVRWLCRGRGYVHYPVFGIPRPAEAVTDLMLMVVFPILDLLGYRQWFRDYSERRYRRLRKLAA